MGLCSSNSQPEQPQKGPNAPMPKIIASHQQEEKKAEEIVKQDEVRDLDDKKKRISIMMVPSVANEKMEHEEKQTEELI